MFHHVKVTGKGASVLVGSVESVHHLLCELAKGLGEAGEMLRISSREEDRGVVGSLMLAAAACSVMTHVAEHSFALDVLARDPVDVAFVVDKVRRHFGSFGVRAVDLSTTPRVDD